MEINNMKILINRKDGGVSIMSLSGEAESAEVEVAKWAELHKDSYISHRVISDEDIPPIREFRDAWTDVTEETSIDIDLAKAKDVALNRLRAERNKELDNLDKKLMIAMEMESDDVQSLKEKKQALRDVTEPLKALQAEGVNDENVLNQIKQLSMLGDV